MACSTTPLSSGQLQSLATNAGFSSSMAPLMAAIALAESGGCPTATNPTDNGGTQTSWGLWQISYGNHQAPAGWSNPQTNANLAFQKYQSQGLGAWGTYTSGKYKDFLGGSSNVDLASTLGLTGMQVSSQQASTTSCAPWDVPCILQQLISDDIMQRATILFVGMLLALVGVIVLFVSSGGVEKTAKAGEVAALA